ncbi:MAG: hypothetical protein LAP61_22935 [Acidobacteriia bacterium]|nr:hypothetical protein [Terriglobia bacterium]
MKQPVATPRRRRTPPLPTALPSSRVTEPSSSAETLELSSLTADTPDAQAKRAALMSEALGAVTGVGPNKPVAQRLLAQLHSVLPGETDIAKALFTFAELRPKNMLEAMLVTQMVGVHEAALAFLRTSTNAALGEETRDQNALRAARFMRLFNEQIEQLQRLKGTNRQQKVIVEHVHVNAGGQAIVGVVAPREGGVKKKTDG